MGLAYRGKGYQAVSQLVSSFEFDCQVLHSTMWLISLRICWSIEGRCGHLRSVCWTELSKRSWWTIANPLLIWWWSSAPRSVLNNFYYLFNLTTFFSHLNGLRLFFVFVYLLSSGPSGITNHDEYSLVRENLEEEAENKPNFGTLTLRRRKEEKERDQKMEQLKKKIKTDDERKLKKNTEKKRL